MGVAFLFGGVQITVPHKFLKEASEWRQKLEMISSDCFVAKSLEIVRNALRLAASPEEAVLAFNGGKDCTVLLYLVLFCWKFDTPLELLYFSIPDGFEEEDRFTRETAKSLGLPILEIPNLPLREGMKKLKIDRQNLRFIFMGTRRTDPHGGNLDPFAPTDESYPAFMRVNPILDWSYNQVWFFLDFLGVPVNPLYSLGYTSVGSVKSTKKNPHLFIKEETYAHARELKTERDERAGRS